MVCGSHDVPASVMELHPTFYPLTVEVGRAKTACPGHLPSEGVKMACGGLEMIIISVQLRLVPTYSMPSTQHLGYTKNIMEGKEKN